MSSSVTKSGGVAITFSYDASGRKYKKSVTGTDTYVKDYINGIDYKDGSLEAIYHEEGRVGKDASGNLRYEFTIRDHLGNSRVMFADINGDGTIQLDDPDTPANESELLQENHYYPFGMNMEGGWTAQVGEKNQYQYNGKELNEDLDLGWSDYGARWYDAAVGRFTGIDILADEPHNIRLTPYHFVANNPIVNLDPDGLDWYSNNETGEVHWEKGSEEKEGHTNIGSTYTIYGDQQTIVHEQNEVVEVISNEEETLEPLEVKSPSATPMSAALVTTGVLVADDATVVGVADDVAIPFVFILLYISLLLERQIVAN